MWPLWIIVAEMLTLHLVRRIYSVDGWISRRGHFSRELLSSSLTKSFDAGIQLCVNQCKMSKACQLKTYLRVRLECNLHSTPVATAIIHESHPVRSAFISVLNKTKCPSPGGLTCSLTHFCTLRSEKDCRSTIKTAVKQNAQKLKKTASAKNKITVKSIKFIAASSRYTNILYGHGSRVGGISRILSFNISRTLYVQEQTLSSGIKHRQNGLVFGMTTGPCHTGRAACVYIGYNVGTSSPSKKGSRRYLVLRSFEEPDVKRQHVAVKYSFCKVTGAGSVTSIAMNRSLHMYMLTYYSKKSRISVGRVYRYKGIMRYRKIKECTITLRPLSLDVMKKGTELLILGNKCTFLLSTRNMPATVTETHLRESGQCNDVEGNGLLSCILNYKRYAVFVTQNYPYRMKIFVFKH